MGNLALYATKGFEYLLILGFLAVFTIFYLYLTSQGFEKDTASLGHAADRLMDWFHIPEGVLFHQGHTWAKEERGSGFAVIGMDDFARKMAGPMAFANLPATGTIVKQGERGWSLYQGSKNIDMLAPLSGVVMAVNKHLFATQANAFGYDKNPANDPYGNGWILKIKPENIERERKSLFSGELAGKWMEGVVNRLRLRMSPEFGMVFQDGGEPMPGIAKNIDRKEWDRLLREFFLTE
ncbi:MAG: hypothetical protein P8130_03540 [Deltaproteobacteria bacterium]